MKVINVNPLDKILIKRHLDSIISLSVNGKDIPVSEYGDIQIKCIVETQIEEKKAAKDNDRLLEKIGNMVDNESVHLDLLKTKQENEKLKSDLETLRYEQNEAIKIIRLIPGVMDGDDLVVELDILESFIRKALGRERERSKWYLAKYNTEGYPNAVLQPCYYNMGREWFCCWR